MWKYGKKQMKFVLEMEKAGMNIFLKTGSVIPKRIHALGPDRDEEHLKSLRYRSAWSEARGRTVGARERYSEWTKKEDRKNDAPAAPIPDCDFVATPYPIAQCKDLDRGGIKHSGATWWNIFMNTSLIHEDLVERMEKKTLCFWSPPLLNKVSAYWYT